MEPDDVEHPAEPVRGITISAGGAPADPADLRARWRAMPPPVHPDAWVADHDPDPLPESLLQAEADREDRERRYLIERGGGVGA